MTRYRILRRRQPHLAAFVCLPCLLWAAVASPALALGQPEGEPPSILLIVTDDQRYDTLWAMPTVQERLIGRGVTFDNAFVVNPLCCPSRASILTGDYSHTTGVYRQRPPHGRFDWFRDGTTIATRLDDAGYTTGYFGKYLDGYQHAALTGYVPPGWDRWMAFVHSAYLDYKLSVDGVVRSYASAPDDYSTDVLGEAAVSFIEQEQGQLLVVFAPAAPHSPAVPAERHAGAFPDLQPWRPPSYDEPDVSDKPGHIRGLPPIDPSRASAMDELRADQYRTLPAVDEQIGRLLDALEETGRLSSTLVVLTSDNGLSWGEHRWDKKEVPYEESIRVPFVLRFDPLVAEARDDQHLVLNIDIAPTIADVAGVPARETDGESLTPLLVAGAAPWRSDFLVEHMEGANPVPTYCALRTEEALYVRYATGEEELYELTSDPFELRNRVTAPELASLADRLRERLAVLCRPPPPGLEDRFPYLRTLVGVLALAALLLAARRLGSAPGHRSSVRER
ncbi:MAG: sulfatase family protein [Actinomycetota bacterium]